MITVKTVDSSNADFKISMVVGTAVEFQGMLLDLMSSYKSKGITEIPISVLEQMFVEGAVKNMQSGLLSHMMKEANND